MKITLNNNYLAKNLKKVASSLKSVRNVSVMSSHVDQYISSASSELRDYNLPKSLKVSLLAQKLLIKSCLGNTSRPNWYFLSLLEGLQKDIPVFKDLSIKQIAFLGNDLNSIAIKQGCYSHCSHCYAGALKPLKETGAVVNSPLFEDVKALADGFSELKKRSGINFVRSSSSLADYHSYVYDSDNILIAIKDTKGKIHEFPEINKMFYDATGQVGIFDTSGWSVNSKQMQQRAERLVEYYSKENHMDELLQFNVSINPFHSIYAKAIEHKEAGNEEMYNKFYDLYVDRIANALFTFSPLLKDNKFGIIIRAFSNKIPNMDFYNESSVTNMLKDIVDSFIGKLQTDFVTDRKYIKDPSDIVNLTKILVEKCSLIDTEMVMGERLKKLFLSKNPNMDRFEYFWLFPKSDAMSELYDQMKRKNTVDINGVRYLKLIDSTGKVYLSDSYRVIPTDIQLNYINKNKKADIFHPLVDDFVFSTKDL